MTEKPAEDAERKNVLVVDDSKSIRTLLRIFMRRLPIDATFARDGVEALDIIKQSPPDLIVLDLMMPRMDGLTLLDRLNQIRGMEFVPRIVISSRTDTESMASSMSKGVIAYLTKPIDFDILAPTILEALDLELSPELDDA